MGVKRGGERAGGRGGGVACLRDDERLEGRLRQRVELEIFARRDGGEGERVSFDVVVGS